MAAKSLYFSLRKCSFSTFILFLLLLAGPSSTLALHPSASRVRTGLEGQAGVDSKLGEEVKTKNRGTIKGNAETGFGHSRVPKPRAELTVAGDNDEVWGDPNTGTGFRSVLSIGEGGLWEPRSSSRCVSIPTGMVLCQNIGYDKMRMPNLLGHESPAEAVQQSASWLPLLARECHPDARIFLCSLFAPICLDRYVNIKKNGYLSFKN